MRFALEKAGGYHFEGEKLIDDGGIAFTRSLIDSENVGLENIAQLLGHSETRLLWQWWWTLLGHLDDSRYMPRLRDPITGDWQGVDVFAGEVSITPSVTVLLKGPQTSAYPQQLPTQGAAFQYLSGETILHLSEDVTVQVLRLKYP
ncbi:MAG: hypothetical protein ACRCYY_21770 [Trueperaceae bacterium]